MFKYRRVIDSCTWLIDILLADGRLQEISAEDKEERRNESGQFEKLSNLLTSEYV